MDRQIIAEMIEKQNRSIEQMIQDSEACINMKIEALFDGYKLTHDKQWELDSLIKAG